MKLCKIRRDSEEETKYFKIELVNEYYFKQKIKSNSAQVFYMHMALVKRLNYQISFESREALLFLLMHV